MSEPTIIISDEDTDKVLVETFTGTSQCRDWCYYELYTNSDSGKTTLYRLKLTPKERPPWRKMFPTLERGKATLRRIKEDHQWVLDEDKRIAEEKVVNKLIVNYLGKIYGNETPSQKRNITFLRKHISDADLLKIISKEYTIKNLKGLRSFFRTKTWDTFYWYVVKHNG